MKVNKLQMGRIAVQLVYAGLIVAGFFMKIRPLLGILVIGAFIFGNFFCGWICPFGTIQDFMAKIGSLFIKKKFKMPQSIQKYLQFSRYIMFAALIIIVGKEKIVNPVDSYHTFIGILSGHTAQTVALSIMIIFLLIALFFDRPFCNYFCSEGIKYGLFSFTRIFSIKRDKETCINCKKCDTACPMNIQVSTKDHVRNAQCINCFQCTDSCPIKGTLKFGNIKVISKIMAIIKKKK